MAGKIFRSTLFVAAVVLLCAIGIIIGVVYNYFDGIQIRQLRDELKLAAIGTEQQGLPFLVSAGQKGFRLTWVAGDGSVIYDTDADETAMENHADREEIREALESGTGSAARYSTTLTRKTMYEARALSDGSVLRISVRGTTTASLVLEMLQPILIVVVIAIVLSAFLSHRMARRIVQPLNQLDLEHPEENHAYEEISPLLHRIGQQHRQIADQVQKLKEETDEFDQITQNMQEGLVLLDKNGRVRSINPAAEHLLEQENSCIGRDFLSIDRCSGLKEAVDAMFRQGHSEARARKNGREYQLELSRIQSEGLVIGAVILAFDVTEQTHAERNRREFSANVSHELKTPLQSIIGSAELLENGLVRPEDTPRFVGHIRKEASRLVSLVEDIIRLSQLDEGVEMPREQVDLLELAEDAAEALGEAAAGLQLSVEGEPCVVTGVRRLLYEILYNLCDNAIKYNVPGGSITVRTGISGGRPVLSVADTGIGIPPEHQARVFERFYRVDKSHSRQSGGTGLGLSIVKHAVQYHRARLDMESRPGHGTVITVTFPEAAEENH